MNENNQSTALERLVALSVIGISHFDYATPGSSNGPSLALNVGLAITMMLVALRLKRALEFLFSRPFY